VWDSCAYFVILINFFFFFVFKGALVCVAHIPLFVLFHFCTVVAGVDHCVASFDYCDLWTLGLAKGKESIGEKARDSSETKLGR